MDTNSDGDVIIKDQVVAKLREKKIKLWLTPYVSDDGSPRRATLENLASTLMPDGQTKESVVDSLLDIQSHALEKLASKKTKKKAEAAAQLELKILGLKQDEGQTLDLPKTTALWANRVELTETTNVIKLYQINPDLTMDTFVKDLIDLLRIDTLRLVYKGKCITNTTTNNARLNHMVATSSSTAAKMICLVSYKKEEGSTDAILISSIRRAASKLGTNFEVTDQHGSNVAMLPSERKAFLTALGLHRLGRKQTELEASLVFLLEADKEWDSIAPNWRDKVDNYGLLQLDIAWVYLKLESIENLTDTTERLQVAETVLRKQVDSNFVTLAIVQADMGNPVPPLAAVFCRLFLLQGVALRFSTSTSGEQGTPTIASLKSSKERLDWAYGLCQSLRSVSSEESIQGLCEAIGATEFQVISALRRSNGNSDQAASLIEEEEGNAERQAELRYLQRKLGLCENKVDHVEVDLVPQLQTVLGLTSATASDQSDRKVIATDPNYLIAAGLLRLANNDLQASIDIYQEVERDAEEILSRVAILDNVLHKEGLGFKKKRKTNKNGESTHVDEIALASLISMGVTESEARTALEKLQNNIEAALLWVTSQNEDATLTNTAVPMEAESTFDEAATTTDSAARDNSSDITGNKRRMKTSDDDYDDKLTEAELRAEAELKESLQEHDLEKDYFGSKLDEEWAFLQKFRAD